MKKLLIASLYLFTVIFCNGQTAEELNQQAKTLLSEHDFKLAVPILKKAAEAGNIEAQYNYGICFEQGVEVQKSDTIANMWFLKSAMQGYVNAEFKIAYSYATGRGCAEDAKQAFYWSLKCAEQMTLNACSIL
jgi:TPR repeat protein